MLVETKLLQQNVQPRPQIGAVSRIKSTYSAPHREKTLTSLWSVCAKGCPAATKPASPTDNNKSYVSKHKQANKVCVLRPCDPHL